MSTMKKLFAIIGILGSLYSLFYFGMWREWKMPPWPLFLFLLFLILLEMATRAVRLCRAVEIIGKKISFWEAFQTNALGDVWGALTPSGIGGEVARLAGLVRCGLSTKGSLKVLGVERLSLLLSLGLLLVGMGVVQVSPWSSLMIFCSLALAFIILGMALMGYWRRHWLPYLWRWDIFLLSFFHHLVRLGLLPLIVFYYLGTFPPPLVYGYSLLLGYGFSLLPIPSGGGTVEVAFMSALGPLLGEGMAATSLLVWRFLGHYFYVLSGAVIALWGLPLWGSPLGCSKCFLHPSQTVINKGDSLDAK